MLNSKWCELLFIRVLSEETVMKALLCTDVQIKFRGGSADVAGTFRNYSYGSEILRIRGLK